MVFNININIIYSNVICCLICKCIRPPNHTDWNHFSSGSTVSFVTLVVSCAKPKRDLYGSGGSGE